MGIIDLYMVRAPFHGSLRIYEQEEQISIHFLLVRYILEIFLEIIRFNIRFIIGNYLLGVVENI